jgi:hypothetical protein
MRSQKFSFLISVGAGLFLALNFSMYFFFYSDLNFKWVSIKYQISIYLETAALFFTVGFVVVVFFSFVIGWPLYLIAKKYSLVNYVTSALGGVAVTVIPLVLLIKLGWNIPGLATYEGKLILFILIFCGAISGMIFNRLESKNTIN